jgi:RhtB (resistance to homoserine/threonine) family protein
MISRNSLVYSRRAGIISALGLACGILVHVTYCIIGIGYIISRSILLFSILKFLGAAYLIYIGWKAIQTRPQKESKFVEERKEMSDVAALRMGFLTNVFNPKVTLFFFALFTQVISPYTPKLIQILYGAEMFVMTFAWFALVAVLLSLERIRNAFAKAQHKIERVFGVLLVALGIKVALSHK